MNQGCRFPVRILARGLATVSLALLLFGGTRGAGAQIDVVKPVNKSSQAVKPRTVNPVLNPGKIAGGGSTSTAATSTPTSTSTAPVTSRMRGTTNAQRKAAAANLATRRTIQPQAKAKAFRLQSNAIQSNAIQSNAIVGVPGNPAGPATLDQLYFSGTYPNYANSPLPNVADTVNCQAPNYCGMRKFVDTLPLLNTANNLGNMLPVAVPDTTTFPGADYYEISLVEYRAQLHSDLPAVSGTWPNQSGGTQLRGYVQTNGPLGTAQPPYYLGPIIVAQSNRPVRVKFTNALPTGTAGNLFIPTDLTSLGAGLGMANGQSPYLQNRATVHLHGGNTPWISDGTPHQWTIPAGDWGNTQYQRGDSVQFVPDMYYVNGVVVPQCSATVTTNCSDAPGMTGQAHLPAGATNDPGNGSLTFYYTNQQSGRLLFYHDHAYGTTRLNVYAGEAAGFLITDNVDADLTNGTNTSGVFTQAGIAPARLYPAEQIPLVIQDKTFVPQNFASTTVYSVPVLSGGEGYTTAMVSFAGGCTTEPTAVAVIGDSVDDFGQLIVGSVNDIALTSAGSGCSSDPIVTITGDGAGATAFASIASLSQQDPTWDTALWGSYGNLWYPHVYMPNQWPGNPDGSNTNPMGRWDYASWFWPPFNGNPGQYTVRGEIPCPTAYDPTMTCPGFPSALAPAPTNEVSGAVHLGQGSTVSITPEGFMDTPLVNGVAYPKLTVDPKPYRFRILSVANERTFNLSWFLACDSNGGTAQYTPTVGASCPAPTVPGVPNLTEVGMVPAVATAGFPARWPVDGRTGGVPDPKAAGPSWLQVGTESGVLPALATIPPTPIAYETNMRSVTVTNMSSHGLLLMSAERADAIVDFTPYACKTLILYNDAPAPAPAHDDRYDYYTDDPDFTGTGGAPTTLAGFGPNTRTLMQVTVNCSVTGPAEPAVNMTALNAVIPAAFNVSQPPPVVPESTYSKAYGQAFNDTFPRLQSTAITFTPIDPSTKKLSTIINPATGNTTVTIPLRMKTIQELFELDYGRMNATLGTELPLTNFNTQTTIPLGYIDPFTEDIYDSSNLAASPVGIGADGSQIWMVVHNGVDSHAIHFHLYDVQLVDRFGWDGTTRPPFPDELGWKDTVRMNPLEIDFVALRPMKMTLPFPVPDSARLFDVTRPAGPDPQMTAFDPLNNAAPQMNQVQPMGWEYVWHCHLLGHEENDMMREQVFQVTPEAPSNLTAVASKVGNLLTFTDNSLSEAGFDVQRADDASFTSNVTTMSGAISARAGYGGTVSYMDSTSVLGHTYYYRVRSEKPDADYWTPLIGPLAGPGQGTPTTLPSLVSAWTPAMVPTAAAGIQVSPLAMVFGTQAYNTTSAATSTTITSTGLANLVIGSISITGTNPGDFSYTTTCPPSPNPLAPAATCTISVRFTPKYAGTRLATLAINSNDPATPVLTVSLTGTGGLIPLKITASSPTINWGAAVPVITPVFTPVPPDPVSAFGTITCTTTYQLTSPVGTYPSTCSGASNPNNAYSITYAPGKVTVNAVAAVMISPTPGSTLAGSTVTFTWTTGGGTGPYAIQVSTVFGGNELYSSGRITTTSATVTTISTTGKTIYVRLQTVVNGAWQSVNYTYTAPPPVANAQKAALLSPTSGPITSSPVTFQWSKGVGVNYYQLWVSAVGVGGSEIYHSVWLTGQSVTVPVPINTKLYVRLASLVNGQWQTTDYVF